MRLLSVVRTFIFQYLLWGGGFKFAFFSEVEYKTLYIYSIASEKIYHVCVFFEGGGALSSGEPSLSVFFF